MRKASVMKQITVALTAALMAGPVSAWTDKPVKLVVPAPPGGTADTAARIIAEQISANIRQPVIVENKPGGGGAIGVTTVLGAAPDGQTLFFGAQNVLSEVPLVLKVGFDPLKDLVPVAEVARSTLVMVASPNLKADGLKDVIAYVKANPGKVSYASYSAGTVSHYAGLVLNQRAGIDLLHVPYKGSPSGLQDVMGGQIPLMFDGIVTSLPLIRSSKLKAIAIAARTRSNLLPQTPTFIELGYADFEFANWIGVVASSKLPADKTARINAEFVKAAATPEVRNRLVGLGFEQSPASTPAQLEKSVRADYDRNAGIVKTFNIKFE